MIDTSRRDRTGRYHKQRNHFTCRGSNNKVKSSVQVLVNKVWSEESFGCHAARMRRFCPVDRGSLKEKVFCFSYGTGLGVSPCKSVGYMGSNVPVVKR